MSLSVMSSTDQSLVWPVSWVSRLQAPREVEYQRSVRDTQFEVHPTYKFSRFQRYDVGWGDITEKEGGAAKTQPKGSGTQASFGEAFVCDAMLIREPGKPPRFEVASSLEGPQLTAMEIVSRHELPSHELWLSPPTERPFTTIITGSSLDHKIPLKQGCEEWWRQSMFKGKTLRAVHMSEWPPSGKRPGESAEARVRLGFVLTDEGLEPDVITRMVEDTHYHLVSKGFEWFPHFHADRARFPSSQSAEFEE